MKTEPDKSYIAKSGAKVADSLLINIRHLRHGLHAAKTFSTGGFMNTTCSILSWSHIRLLMAIQDPLKRQLETVTRQMEVGQL